jgi:hypothetical protein
MFFSAAVALAGANVVLAAASVSRPAESTIEPAATAISAAAASATPIVLTSDVKGKGFDRIVQIWLENTVGLHIPHLSHPNANAHARTRTTPSPPATRA